MSGRELFGDRIKRLRVLADLKARALDELAGLTGGHVRRLEKGRPQVAAATVADIAGVFGVTMDWLYQGRGDAPRNADILESVARARRAVARRLRS